MEVVSGEQALRGAGLQSGRQLTRRSCWSEFVGQMVTGTGVGNGRRKKAGKDAY